MATVPDTHRMGVIANKMKTKSVQPKPVRHSKTTSGPAPPFFQKAGRAQPATDSERIPIGASGDKYEREADMVTDRAIQTDKSSAAPNLKLVHQLSTSIQRKTEVNAESKSGRKREEERLQRQAENEKEEVQLMQQAKGEPTEQEEELQRQAEKEEEKIQAQGDENELQGDLGNMSPPEADQLQRQPEDEQEEGALQRMVEKEEENVQRQPELNQPAANLPETTVGRYAGADFVRRLRIEEGGGSSIPYPLRQIMSRLFAANFDKVRLHTGARAARLSDEIGARAFTHGRHIFFGQGNFDPESRPGRLLLAHELTHTIQQGAAKATSQETEPEQSQKTRSTQIEAERTETPTASTGTPGEPSETSKVSEDFHSLVSGGNGSVQSIKEQSKVEEPAAEPKLEENGEGAETATGEQAPTTPEEDPEFQDSLIHINKTRRRQGRHAPPDTKVGEVNQAAVLPESDQADKNARLGHLNTMNTVANESETGEPFKPETFKELLQKNLTEIERKLPTSESGAKRFKREKPLDDVKQNVRNQVVEANKKAGEPLANQAASDPPASKDPVDQAVDLQEEKAGQSPKQISKTAAAPKPKFDSQISMKRESQSLDELMVKNQLTEKQLENSNEPTFLEALNTKREAQEKADEAPGIYREQEQAILNQAQEQAGTAGKKKLGAMFSDRKKKFGEVFAKQGTSEKASEEKQSAVYKELATTYEETKQHVNEIFTYLTDQVNTIFSTEVEDAKDLFEERVEDKLDDIYGYFKIDDAIFGEDTEAIEEAFQVEKERFLTAMNNTLDKIAKLIAKWLNAAIGWIRWGKNKSLRIFNSLSAEEQKKSKEALDFFTSQYDNLEGSVHDKQEELASTLADSYHENVTSLRESFDKIKEEVSKGWLQKAAEFVKDVATAIAKLAELLFTVLKRLAGIIGNILDHPIRFLENLGSGIAAGFDEFIGGLDKFLIGGFFDWLRGSVSKQGITIPEKLDARGMFSLTTQVLSLNYQTFRDRAVKKFGEKTVQILEKGVEFAGQGLELIQLAREQGLGALWERIKEMVSSNVDAMFDKIKQTVVAETIKKTLAFIASLFTPAGAFIKAVQLLYKGLKFLIDNIDRISELVNTFLDSLELAVAGNVEAIKAKVVLALRNLIVVAIDFLAKILNLGNLDEKVRKILNFLRKPIIRAMDFVLERMRPAVRGIQKLAAKGEAKVKSAGQAVLGFLFPEYKFNAGGEAHSLSVEADGSTQKIFFASKPQPLEQFLINYESTHGSTLSTRQKKKIAEAKAYITNNINPLIKQIKEKKNAPPATLKALNRKMLEHEVKLSGMLKSILGKKSDIAFSQEKYRLEGLAGTYGSMPKPKSDKFTADHQPQAAVLQIAADLPYFKNYPEGSKMKARAAKRANKGYAINLHERRHTAGRTYGGKSQTTLNDFNFQVDIMTADLKTPEKKRAVVIDLIKEELQADVEAMNKVTAKKLENKVWQDINDLSIDPEEKKKLRDQSKKQIERGEGLIASQDLDSLKG